MTLMTSILMCCLLSILPLAMSTAQAQTPGVTKEKYNDFYRRQKQMAKDEEMRESGRVKYGQMKEQERIELERIEAAYAKKSRSQDQEKQDRIAEEWMEKQNQKHEEAMNQARQKYISSKKENTKYKIPESEEYDVK